jgi:hypothetical protein
MTPSDLAAIANRNLRVLDATVDKLIAAGAKSEWRAVELGLLYIIRRINDENSTDRRRAAGQ